jgi:hypothetical protein
MGYSRGMGKRSRTGDKDEELADELDDLAAASGGDLGSILMSVQEGAGNAALATLVGQVESGEAPADALLPGNGSGGARDEQLSERERQGIADRAAHGALKQRLISAKVSPFAKRIEGELSSFERRLEDAREYGWIGTDAAVLDSELSELEQKLVRAEGEEEAMRALAAVDLKRQPLYERARKAITERLGVSKPGMMLYAPEDFEALGELDEQLGELHKRLSENAIAVTTVRGSLGALSEVSTAYAKSAAANLAEEVQKAGVVLGELELALSEITDRHSRANAEDRDRLTKLMEGLEPRLRKEPHRAMAGGASKQEIDYLIKKAWLEQHEATQRLAKDELWTVVAGFPPNEGKVAYFDLPQRMGDWRIHFTLDYGVMKAVDVGCSEQDIKDALLGATAGVVLRSHATAEVLGRSDDRNPHYYYNAGRVTPRREFWETPEGKRAKRNWSTNQGKLMDAFDVKADELVKIVRDVLEERKELKAVVVKAGETLKWV